MNLLKIVALAMAVTAIPAAVYAQTTMTPEECTAMMTKADVNGDGSIATDEAAPFAKAVSSSEEKPANEGVMTGEEFMGFCKQGLFSEIKME